MDLFDNDHSSIPLEMKDADVTFYPNFLEQQDSDRLFNTLLNEISWRQDNITVFGKTYPQPRLTALYASNNKPYTYSNIKMTPLLFTNDLLLIKKEIENVCDVEFTTCLLNLYRDGQDSNGWHADNEKELGDQPVIASLSLGAERWFHFKHRNNKELKKKLLLTHGSLLIMKGKTQECWLHQIPKTKTIHSPRINLTFRVIN